MGEGEVVVDLADGDSVTVGIERLHLEQDAGKSLHDQHATMSYVDLNRSGVALMEIVSKPDLRSAAQAQAFLIKLRSILRYLGTCDGNMEEGSLRADVNVSVRRPGEPFGTRCEIKNMNSIRFIGQAIEHEAQPPGRHSGGGRRDRPGDPAVRSRPRRDPLRCAARKRRTITAISPIRTCCRWNSTQAEIDDLKADLPELPDDKKARFVSVFGVSATDADVLVAASQNTPLTSKNWLMMARSQRRRLPGS